MARVAAFVCVVLAAAALARREAAVETSIPATARPSAPSA
jgi:hypothetical protein